MTRKTHNIFVVLLLLVQTALLCGLNWTTSINRTEVGHLGAAVYFWKTGRFDVFHVNPPLTRMIVGLPILLCSPEQDWKSYSPRPQDRSEWSLGSSFINANTPETVRLCTFLARCSLIPLILLGGWFGFKFASELYNDKSGIIFLVLWTFSPLILGWGATICPDVVAASLGVIAVYYFWHWLKTPDWKNAIIAGVMLGLLPLTKTTWIIAFPLWCLLWAFWKFPNTKQFVVALLLAIYVLNMGYGFDGSFQQLNSYTFISDTLTGNENNRNNKSIRPGNRFANSFLGEIPVPFPGEFVQGIDTQKRDFETGLESYFRGVTSDHGWWYYYPYTLLIREPLGVWGLVLLTLLVSCFGKLRLDCRNEFILLTPFVTIFTIICMQTGFSIHPRYVVVILPFAYLWVSKLGLLFSRQNKFVTTFTTLFLLWFVASSLWCYPHSMSYFNESIGGPKNGPKHLLGSNVDWGQNLYFLQSWIKSHPDATPLYVDYSASDSLKRLGFDDVRPIPSDREPGWYVIGVNELYGSKQYEDFRNANPVDRIGWGIYVFKIESE